jgi:hypothetical protein
MTQEMMQELGRRIIEAAHMAVAMHLEQARESENQGVDTDQRLRAQATGGAGWQRSTDGLQPLEGARDGGSPTAGREAA